MTLKRYERYKDSGVEWLGPVPEHWQVTRLKFIAHAQTGVAKGKDNTGQETISVPYLRVANVQDGYLDLDEVATIEIPAADLQRYRLRAGDVLMNEGGDFDKLGRGHVWDGSIDPCIHQNHVFAVRPFGVSPQWLNGSTLHRDRSDFWSGGEYPWLSSTVVNSDVVPESSEFVTELAMSECHLPWVRPPAVLIGITGQGKTRGMAALLGIEATINQHIAFVKPRAEQISAEYLRRYFEMAYQRMRFESDGVGSTKDAITCEQIASMPVPVPPPGEQASIAAHLDRVTSALDRLAAEAKAAVGLLHERRTALISASVTGQIDVRDRPSLDSNLEETPAYSAAGRHWAGSAAAHVARLQTMGSADEQPALPPTSC